MASVNSLRGSAIASYGEIVLMRVSLFASIYSPFAGVWFDFLIQDKNSLHNKWTYASEEF